MLRRSPLGAIVAGLLLAAPAAAAPPANDLPTTPVDLQPFQAVNGVPTQLFAYGDLVEATPDAGVPRCLGGRSFERTVWLRLPAREGASVVDVEAVGRRIDPLDLAAFVQEPDGSLSTTEPQACDGPGAGAGADAEEPTSSVSLIVPSGHPVLFQLGRREVPGSQEDEAALVDADVVPAAAVVTPSGDRARPGTRRLRTTGVNVVDVGGATLTPEDPAQPACPSAGTVWRRLVPSRSGTALVTVTGNAASTLTAFRGGRPTGDNVVDCVNREGRGDLQLALPVRGGRTTWIRIGAERTLGDEDVDVTVRDGSAAVVVDGGPGGFDPTPYGPGGGLPVDCDVADVSSSRVSGPTVRARARAFNRRALVPVRVRVRGDAVCAARLRLYGPRGRVYAETLAVRLKPKRQTVQLLRKRALRPGRYRLRVDGADLRGRPATVRGRVTWRIRK